MNSTASFFALCATLTVCHFGCAASDAPIEPSGSTTENLTQGDSEFQPRMRQSKMLLRRAADAITATSPDSAALPLIAQALKEVQEGIDFDATHVTPNENNRLENAANVAVRTSIQQCAQDPSTQGACLLQAAQAKLKAATTDKGGYRVKAMATIGQALAAL